MLIATPAWWRNAWAIPPRHLRTREWAERNFIVANGARPGPFRLDANPILGPVLDVLDHPGVRETYLRKAVQTSGSTAARIWMARNAHTDPNFALLVLPSNKSGRKQMRTHWRPVLSGRECPPLRQFQRRRATRRPTKATLAKKPAADDIDRSTYENIVLSNGFDLSLGYAGSATSLASDPAKRVCLDETDKYLDWDQKEAPPIDLARQRMMTYQGVSELFALSTPTTDLGAIHLLFEAADVKLYPFIACPQCGRPIQLIFENVVFDLPDTKQMPDPRVRAAHLRANPELVFLQCGHCPAHVNEQQRRDALQTCWLATLDQTWQLHADGRQVGEKPRGETVGIHLPQLASLLGLSMVEQAAMWIAADGQMATIQTLKNNHHALPFVFHQVKPAKGRLLAKCRRNEETGWEPPPSGKVPPWASRLVMTVDTQAEKFYWVIRAWGARMRSRLIAHGEATTFEQLEYLLHEAVWANEDPSLPSRRCFLCAIDSGGGINRERSNKTRTEQVYRWCAANPTARLALKGSSKPLETLTRMSKTKYQSPDTGDVIEVPLLLVDPLGSGDVLADQQLKEIEAIDVTTGEVLEHKIDQWELNRDVANDYLRHLQVMTRKRIKKDGRGKLVDVWIEEVDGARHDYFDDERYQIAVAHDPTIGCLALPSEGELRASLARASNVKPNTTGGIQTGDGREFFVTQR